MYRPGYKPRDVRRLALLCDGHLTRQVEETLTEMGFDVTPFTTAQDLYRALPLGEKSTDFEGVVAFSRARMMGAGYSEAAGSYVANYLGQHHPTVPLIILRNGSISPEQLSGIEKKGGKVIPVDSTEIKKAIAELKTSIDVRLQ